MKIIFPFFYKYIRSQNLQAWPPQKKVSRYAPGGSLPDTPVTTPDERKAESKQ